MRRTIRALAIASVLALTTAGFTAAPSSAAIHEIIGALCRAGGEEVVPPGQVMDGPSFLRALRATGVIESIDFAAGDGNDVEVTFDLEHPASKYTSGGILVIPNGFGPGIDIILNPLPIPDGDFPAHANCKNLQP